MSTTNTTKENLKDEHNVFFGGVFYDHLLSFLWWSLL
jgi:hypothetical protein